MTTKADYTEQDWELVLEGPTSAGMLIITAQRGGTFRETVSMAKAYAEARQLHGQSELLDSIVATKPELDRTHHGSPEELKAHLLENIGGAASLVRAKATPQEFDEYRRFVVNLAERVAGAHKEKGGGEDPVSDVEHAVIAEIAQALEQSAPAA